jgi:hypothetical protein
LILFCLPFDADDAPERGTPFELIFSGASQNVDERPVIPSGPMSALGALDQHQSEEKEKREIRIRIAALTTRQMTNKRGIDARPPLKQADTSWLTTALPFRSALFLL